MTTSCQPSPHPQASGTAAASASSGITTNSPTRNWLPAELGSGSTSGSGALRGLGGPATRVSGTAVMVVLALLGRRGRETLQGGVLVAGPGAGCGCRGRDTLTSP